jgi:putative PIN family toxin of toxin-antitoxin system
MAVSENPLSASMMVRQRADAAAIRSRMETRRAEGPYRLFDTVHSVIYGIIVIRAVLDTNVIVAALKSPRGASNEILRLADAGQFEIALSVPLATEYEDVLHRPEMEIPLGAEQIEAVLDRLCQVAVNQRVFFLWRPFLRDAKDDMVFETALASRSQFIVTFNVQDFDAVGQFGIRAIRPGDFLLEL